MIKLQWNPTLSEADVVTLPGLVQLVDGFAVQGSGIVQADDGLEAAVIISLFSDARARADDDMTGLAKNKRGWWADTFASPASQTIGSRLWLRRRSPLTSQLLVNVKQDIQDALQWLLDDGIASAVNVTTERFGLDGVRFSVTITKPDAAATRWFRTWEMHFNGI